ncbi:hypothetical protein BS78_07G195000 [Paspalum vaginatum]|nr:hypothetical protein BS78_07G195000 [Paspalum vaginatum]
MNICSDSAFIRRITELQKLSSKRLKFPHQKQIAIRENYLLQILVHRKELKALALQLRTVVGLGAN